MARGGVRTRVDDSDLRKVRRVMERVRDGLEDPSELAHAYAEAVLRKAVQNASARPTPQAAMAAEGMQVQGDTIRSAGGTPGEVASSSEFGSDIYLQFHRSHNPQGYWLLPAGESREVLDAGDDILQQMIDRAVLRG